MCLILFFRSAQFISENSDMKSSFKRLKRIKLNLRRDLAFNMLYCLNSTTLKQTNKQTNKQTKNPFKHFTGTHYIIMFCSVASSISCSQGSSAHEVI